MTMPCERSRAVRHTREFLRALLDPKKTPKVPRTIREWAYRCLRHYPADFYIDKVSKKNPDEFGPLPEDKE